ncbi:DUF3034 family protein [Sphingomonas sp. Leaf357]|uniref:DUF3034 family protein n=1 Tax=Sphingomonas sp. Leaf357 TaxID=1736350 RepID=UPI002E802F51|nr:DUF3034 family protein [Sphingomonas sp. Leaf357]
MTALIAVAMAGPAVAGEMRQGGKMLLTGGVSSIEGAAGGGLATWALIAGNETDAGIGGKVHATYVALPDFDLASAGVAIGIRDRVEISYARQTFDTRQAGAALGLGKGFKFGQDVYGVKVRISGSALYDQDRILPQISIGVQHKRADKAPIIAAVGGKQSNGTDFYVAATKVILSRSLVVDATVRFTKANQFGLLGFGGDLKNRYKPQFEGSAGMLIKRNLLVGAEVRTRPSNLGFAREQRALDAFAAWSVSRNVAFTAAYADLGDIATVRRQRGAFLSLQGSF